jgi:hypothetical protein
MEVVARHGPPSERLEGSNSQRNIGHAFIGEFPAASLRKLTVIEIVHFKMAKFIMNIGGIPAIESHLSRI